MDNLLENITAPQLNSSSYGDDIDATFANIDKNFKTIGNYDFIKGQQGNSIHIEYVNIKKTISESPNSIEILGNDLYKALTKSIEKFICDYNNIPSTGSGSGSGGFTAEVIYNALRNIGVYAWDSWVDDVRVPLIVAENTINETKEYICSAAVVLFCDARFSSTSLGKNYSKFTSDMIDTTCYINFIRNVYTNEWECQINTNYPRLKFKNNTFYWEVNGSETAIRSTGVQGENGKDGNTFICKYESSNPTKDFVDEALLPITDILSSDGTKWDNIDNVDIFDGAPVIVHLTSKETGETTPTYHGYITSHIQIKETLGGGKSGTVVYWSDTDNKLTWIEGASHDVFSILGTKGLDISSVTSPVVEAMPGIFVRMNVGSSSTTPEQAHCIYSINGETNNLDGKTTLMISPKESYLNTLGNNLGGCNLKIEYPTEITTNKEAGGIILVDNSSSLESKIEINNNNSSGVSISAASKPISISTSAGANIDINPSGNTNITSANTNIKSQGNTNITSANTNITSTNSTIIKTNNNTITCGTGGIQIVGDKPITISESLDSKTTDKIEIDNHKIYIATQNSNNSNNSITVSSNKTSSPGINLDAKSGTININGKTGINLESDSGNIDIKSNSGNIIIDSATGVKLRHTGTDKLLINNDYVTLNKIPLKTPAVTFPFGWFSNITPPTNYISTTSEVLIELDWQKLIDSNYSLTFGQIGANTYSNCVRYGNMTIYLKISATSSISDGAVYIRIIDYPTCSLFPIGVLVENNSSYSFSGNVYLQFTNKTSEKPNPNPWVRSKIEIGKNLSPNETVQDIHFILTKHAGSAAKIQAITN